MIPWKLVERAVGALPLLVLPALIAPVIVIWFAGQATDEYFSSANVWVQEIEDVDLVLPGDDVRTTPAGRQQRVLGELLSTTAFAELVAIEAGLLEPASEDGQVALPASTREFRISTVSNSVSVSARGDNLLRVQAGTSSPVLSQAIVGAVLNQYQKRLAGEIEARFLVTITYFQQQLDVAQAELDQREAAFNEYRAAHPEAEEDGVLDLDYSRLLSRVQAQESVVAGLQQSVVSEYQANAAATGALAARFSVVDPPSLPGGPLLPSRTKKWGYPLMAALLGAAVSAGYLYVVFRADHSILSSQDVPDGVKMLGFVPAFDPRTNMSALQKLRLTLRREPMFARHVAASLTQRADSGSDNA